MTTMVFVAISSSAWRFTEGAKKAKRQKIIKMNLIRVFDDKFICYLPPLRIK
jgi:hypothetical protein